MSANTKGKSLLGKSKFLNLSILSWMNKEFLESVVGFKFFALLSNKCYLIIAGHKFTDKFNFPFEKDVAVK